MIFQNPDNQIIGTTVMEDVAFGPENLGVEQSKLEQRVLDSLENAGILDLKDRAPHMLSGGQKQKVGIAGILAMHPKCIILDEATSMLDPIGRRELLKVVMQLNNEENITIIHITHHMEEACLANRVIVVEEGKVILEGTPIEVFSDVDRIENIGLDVPQVTRLFFNLKKLGLVDSNDIITIDDAYERICELLG